MGEGSRKVERERGDGRYGRRKGGGGGVSG